MLTDAPASTFILTGFPSICTVPSTSFRAPQQDLRVAPDGALGRRDAAAVGCRRDHRQGDVHLHGARVDDDGDACPGALGPVLPPHGRHRTTTGGPRGGGIRLVGQRGQGGGVWGGGDGGAHLHHEGVKRADLPHLLTVPLANERGGDVAELLVTVAGRKPLCLRCRRVGQIRRACATPYCRRHGVYGHSTGECEGTVASYSRAARPRTEPEVVEEAPAGTIPGEEEVADAEVDTPAIVSVQATAGVTSVVQPAFVQLCAATADSLNDDWPPLAAASDPPAGNVRPGNVRPDNGDQLGPRL